MSNKLCESSSLSMQRILRYDGCQSPWKKKAEPYHIGRLRGRATCNKCAGKIAWVNRGKSTHWHGSSSEPLKSERAGLCVTCKA